jgi:hypothetical protein
VLCALRFFAIGGYQTGVGYNRLLAVSQKSVSRSITEVTAALNQIMHRWVKFPDNPADQSAVMQGFYKEFHFPGVLGAIDCTHVEIIAPPTDDPEYAEYHYVNRKGNHSVNVQLTCDVDMLILHVNALHPGSASDKIIFRESNLKAFLVQQHTANPNMHCWLIGDSGYSLEPWMMTIDTSAQPGSPEERYNSRLMIARCTVERCNGLLKQRFRCLLKHRVLHYHPEQATQIINACVVLHNMCIKQRLDLEIGSDEEEEENLIEDDSEEEEQIPNPRAARRNPVLIAGEKVRRRLIRKNFQGAVH